MKNLLPQKKKGQVVTSTVMGVGGLLIAVIVLLVITSTLLGAGLFDDLRERAARNNQTVTINDSGVSVGWVNNTDTDCSLVAITNGSATGINETIVAANYTLNSTNCIIYTTTTSTINNTLVHVSTITTFDGSTERATTDMSSNMTTGIGNISAKIPTILLIVAVVFLFGALVLLLRNSRAMGIGGGSSL